MRHPRGPGRRRAAALLLLAALVGGGADQPARDDPLLLDVVVNGRRIGKLGEFRARGGALQATRRELGELGLQPGAGAPDEWVALSTLSGLAARLDAGAQVAAITASPAALLPTRIEPPAIPPPDLAVESGWGAVLNYDVLGTLDAGRARAQALLDARAFSPWGVVSTSALLNAGPGVGLGAGFGLSTAVRLDSGYTYSDPDTMHRVRLGDVISSGLPWTRPLRLGGAQFARDFGLRPDLVTIPVPTIAGQVAVPSSVDVLVNGAQLLSAAAEPGPFEVRRLPVVNGANDISLVVRDAVGQQVTRTVPIYTSTALLAPGLDAYSVEAGAVRLGYGFRSDDYRDPAFSASARRGLTDWLTVSAHAEGSPSLGMAGLGGAVALGSLAVASLAVAGSTSRGGTGAGTDAGSGILAYGALERVGRQLSVSVAAQWTGGRFRDLAALYADPVPSRALRASAGYSFPRAGTLAVAYTRQRRDAVARPILFTGFSGVGGGIGGGANDYGGAGALYGSGTLSGPAFLLPSRTSLVTASYSVALGVAGASFFATAFHDFETRSGSGALFGITVPLGDRNGVAAGVGQNSGSVSGNLQATRSVIAVGDAGGQFYADTGRGSRVLADAQYKSPWALLDVGAYRAANRTAWRGGATGALVLAGGGAFAANAIPDSFAVVDAGREGVDVFYENRPVQRTGRSGRVLVPELRSFESNRLSIDADSLPFDAEPGPTVKLVRPADRSGVVVRFGTAPSRAALVRLVDEAGRPVPVGSTVRVDGSATAIPVGFGGEAYLRDLPAEVSLRVAMPGRPDCRAAFSYSPVPGDIPVVDRLRCVPAP